MKPRSMINLRKKKLCQKHEKRLLIRKFSFNFKHVVICHTNDLSFVKLCLLIRMPPYNVTTKFTVCSYLTWLFSNVDVPSTRDHFFRQLYVFRSVHYKILNFYSKKIQVALYFHSQQINSRILERKKKQKKMN